ncbi:MAG: gliding motility lipoprotein GldB [Lutimonas sp.]
MRILLATTSILVCFFLSCSKEKQNAPDLSGITSDPEIIRFEQLFYESSAEDLPDLKARFPYLFPGDNADSVWVNKIEDEDEQYLYEEVQKQYTDFSDQRSRLESLFKHMKYYFPSFEEPRIITMVTQVDYNNKVLYADSLLFVGLDLYLGEDHEVYGDFPAYVKQNYQKDRLVVDVADALVRPILRPSDDNSFVSRMIQEGKRLEILGLLLPEVPKEEIIGYSQEQWNWAQMSESNIWKYFVQNELLYSTDPELSRRFIEEAPFSKFYMEVDRDSPGRIGSWFGWRIVEAYWSNDDPGMRELITVDNEELFKRSKYKPAK